MLDVITGNSSSAVGNSVNSAEDDTLSLDLSSTCPNPTIQRPYGLQCKLDENVIKLANAEKWYSDTLSLDLSSTCPNLMQHPHWLQCKIDENVTKLANATKWYENNIGHENVSQSMMDVISSVHRNLRCRFTNFIARLINNFISEPGLEEYPCQSEDLEEIIDVDNGINTLKQPDTSVELKKLTEVHPSVYSAAKH
ncbi:hypothetical protein EUZ93_02440 [Wolbachia pipientis]|nr:hypothetical protein [Wolbachia pipientis]